LGALVFLTLLTAFLSLVRQPKKSENPAVIRLEYSVYSDTKALLPALFLQVLSLTESRVEELSWKEMASENWSCILLVGLNLFFREFLFFIHLEHPWVASWSTYEQSDLLDMGSTCSACFSDSGYL